MAHDSQSTRSSTVKIGALFPGQGSQCVGMGKDLFLNFPVAREVFEEASDAVHLDLKHLCFEGSESDLMLTENTQPCLLTTSVAAFRVAEQEFHFKPQAVAGHSLGEYSALVAAGSVPLGTAVRWVRERGKAMQLAVPFGEGTMAALLGMEDELVKKLCSTATEATLQKRKEQAELGFPSAFTVPALVEPANFNAPGQIVIAGSADAVQTAVDFVKTHADFSGGKAIPLSVSAPFHCQLMAPARKQMSRIFSDLPSSAQPKRPVCVLVPNRTARPTQETGVILDLLMEQIDHPVLWNQSMLSLLDLNYTHFIEFGPGKVLSGLLKRISSAASKKVSLSAVGDSTSVKSFEALLNSLENL